MTKTITIEFEDEEYQVFAQIAKLHEVSVESLLHLSVIVTNQSYITGVTNPDVMAEIRETEFGGLMADRVDRAVMKAKKKEADHENPQG